jgi:hypothetical protein
MDLRKESYRGMEYDPGGGLPSMTDLYDRAISLYARAPQKHPPDPVQAGVF